MAPTGIDLDRLTEHPDVLVPCASPDGDAIWFEGTTISHAGFADRVDQRQSPVGVGDVVRVRTARRDLGAGQPLQGHDHLRRRERLSPGAATDPDAVRAALLQQLAAFKVPERIEFVTELPKTATGKVRKPDLRARYVPQP